MKIFGYGEDDCISEDKNCHYHYCDREQGWNNKMSDLVVAVMPDEKQ